MAELAQHDAAVGFYREAFVHALAADDKRAQSICLGSEGNSLFELNDGEGALKCYSDALAISSEIGDLRRVASWLGNIGNTWLKFGDTEKALANCSEAVRVAESIGDQQALAAHLDSLGDCHVAKGELDIAMEKYNAALSLSNTISDRQGKRIYLSNIGRTFEKLGQLQPAFDNFARAIDLFDQQRSAIKADDLKTSFANRGQELYRDMVKVCIAMGKRVDALEFVGRSKSRALLDLLSNSPIDVSQLGDTNDKSLQKLISRESELRLQIAQLERLFWDEPTQSENGHRGAAAPTEDSHKLYSEWRETINQLYRLHPNYASLVSANTLNFEEIISLWQTKGANGQRVLEEDTAILEFYWTDQFVMAGGIWNGTTQPALHTVLSDEEREALESDLFSFLEMSSTEGWEVPQSLCKRIYNKLVEPVIASLPSGIKRLIIVPHGVLHHMPFAALHDGKGFLCERFAISYLPTISLIPVLANSASRLSQGHDRSGYLISAISDYSATRANGVTFSSRVRSAAGLEDLSYTKEEAENIFEMGSKHTATTKLLMNGQVKEELSQLFSEYPIVHFAGHAVFNADEPLASGLVLSDGSILTAASILQANALRTNCGKLLVLSACQTGVNTVTAGGEILGLARALIYAGMPNLVLSLWEVADRSTALLMQDFHKELLEMSGKPESRICDALQIAQSAAARSGQSIHAWAPFIHYGID